MKEYEIFLPLKYNDGAPIEARKFRDVQQRLLERFGGVTYFPQPNEGLWRMGDVTYRDEIVIFRVVSEKRKAARRFLAKLKEHLKKAFRQEEVFIVERDIEVL